MTSKHAWLLLACAACGRIGFDGNTLDDALPSRILDASVDADAPVPTVTQTTATSTVGQTLQFFIAPTGAGNLLVVCADSSLPFETVANITDNANNTYVSANAVSTSGGGGDDIWYAANSNAGATVVTVTYMGSSNVEGWFVEVAGMDRTSPLDVTNITSGTLSGPIVGPTVTTTTPRSFVFSAEDASGSVGAVSFGNTFIGLDEVGGDDSAYLITSSIGTYGAVWDDSQAGVYSSTTVAFKAATE